MKKCIYKITNLINGKIYIGQTNDFARREREHKNQMYGNQNDKPLYKAIAKYGWDNFLIEQIENYCENYNERENYWINYYNSYVPNGYNIDLAEVHSITHKVLTSNELNAIIHDLQESELSIDEIAKKYNFLSAQNIRDINHGITYHNSALSYPLRKTRNEIAKERALEVINDLKNTSLSFKELAQKYDCSSVCISNINTGTRNRVESESYPIRKNTRKGQKFTEQTISAMYADIINTKLPWTELAKKYHCGTKVFQHINQGKIHVREGYEYPLRKVQSKRSEWKALEVIKLLQESNLSCKEISSSVGVSTYSVIMINAGCSYEQPDVKYPIRENLE